MTNYKCYGNIYVIAIILAPLKKLCFFKTKDWQGDIVTGRRRSLDCGRSKDIQDFSKSKSANCGLGSSLSIQVQHAIRLGLGFFFCGYLLESNSITNKANIPRLVTRKRLHKLCSFTVFNRYSARNHIAQPELTHTTKFVVSRTRANSDMRP